MKKQWAREVLSLRMALAYILVSYTLIAISYGLGAMNHPIISISYRADGAFIVSIMLSVVIPIVILMATRWRRAVAATFILFNATLFFYFLYYIGMYSPFNLAWGILIVLTYYYVGRAMAVVSSLILAVMTAWSISDFLPYLGEWKVAYASLSVALVAVTVASAYAIIRIVENSRQRAISLEESRHSEATQLSRLNTLLNSISDTVLTLNKYGRITSENSAALSFFDTNQSLVGKDIDKVFNVRDASLQPISARSLIKDLQATIVRDDLSIEIPDSGVMRLSVQVSPIRTNYQEDARESGAVLIIRDITRQKALEDEKDEFISVTSHELRTPITIAEGSLSNLLFMFDKGAKPDALRSSVVMAHDQIVYLARMINDLSTLSRAERGLGDSQEEINLMDLLQELYLRYQHEAEQKGLQLDLDISKLPSVTTSRLYLEETLQNFVTNAIKYTKEGKVTMSAHHKDGRVVFSITDTGIGISKSDQAKIFDKFYRSEDYRTRETGGTGLGLYVVHKLADKLGTKIEVESRLNHGSTFSFSLPASKAAKHEVDTVAVSNIEAKVTS